jgi:hypothetical protein
MKALVTLLNPGTQNCSNNAPRSTVVVGNSSYVLSSFHNAPEKEGQIQRLDMTRLKLRVDNRKLNRDLLNIGTCYISENLL